jgi:hypothetical protein
MKAKTYQLIQECVENGVQLGFNRAHKHTDTPSDEELQNKIIDSVMLEICEWFTFDEEAQ